MGVLRCEPSAPWEPAWVGYTAPGKKVHQKSSEFEAIAILFFYPTESCSEMQIKSQAFFNIHTFFCLYKLHESAVQFY